jgi:hypothetical protein
MGMEHWTDAERDRQMWLPYLIGRLGFQRLALRFPTSQVASQTVIQLQHMKHPQQ